MDWLDSMNNALNFIELHLGNEINFDDVANKACCSTYHFQRMFSYIAGVSLSEYIRRRRLTLAAFELQNTDVKIIDLAVKYGYESPEAFARAFKKLHSVTPTLARDKGITLKAYPKISFQISIKGDIEMQYRIETKEAFEVFGIERIFGNDEADKVPEFWKECHNNGEYERLFQATGGVKSTRGSCVINAASGYCEPGENVFPYMICAFLKNGCKTDGFKVAQIPKATWAIFRSDETDTAELQIPQLFSRVYSEWFPSTGYDRAIGPDMEIYGISDNGKYYEEVWIPVKKK